MDKQLKHLITDYLTNVRVAIDLMQQSGIPMPATDRAWIKCDIPVHGKLKDGSTYYKHGCGCAVTLPTGCVDFDFGEIGEIDIFDDWRLIKFAKSRLADYGYDSTAAIKKSFECAVKSGVLLQSTGSLYYIAGCKRKLAIEINRDFPNDPLPYINHDKVLTLYSTCFLAADLMRRNYEKLWQKWDKNGRLSQNDEVNLRIYFSSWLGYLGVTCEGFNKLNVRSLLLEKRPTHFRDLIVQYDSINHFFKRHADSLRKFRNNVFHLQDDIQPILRFAADDRGRLEWARVLHSDIGDFFSEYRVACEVHYFMMGRIDESQLRKKQVRKPK